MRYISTRESTSPAISSAQAIIKGISDDGGLFVPEALPQISLSQIEKFSAMSYNDRAKSILSLFLDDYSFEEISACVDSAYNGRSFDHPEIAPVHKLNSTMNVLELWHGPTCAFKDMALQILPYFMTKAIEKTGETDELVILVATSGDTGKAALEGFSGVKGTKVMVFYPEDGVSDVQKKQMVTQEGGNVSVIAVKGNFDDTQNGVKWIFTNSDIKNRMSAKGFRFSSANSINWGRLVPQIVYYFSAYADLLFRGDISLGEKINFCVPTGNFGNILAAYYAMKMGLPINKLICASNENNVLSDFIRTGKYDRRRDFKKTMSPSMDILISSNLERLIFDLADRDSTLVNKWMSGLKNDGFYDIGAELKNKLNKFIWGDYSGEHETLKTIEAIYNEYNYVIDTHTAVAIDVYDKYLISTGDTSKTAVASTASPFKFNESVFTAIYGADAVSGKSEFELLGELSKRAGIPVPTGLMDLEHKKVLHTESCETDGMAGVVRRIFGLF